MNAHHHQHSDLEHNTSDCHFPSASDKHYMCVCMLLGSVAAMMLCVLGMGVGGLLVPA